MWHIGRRVRCELSSLLVWVHASETWLDCPLFEVVSLSSSLGLRQVKRSPMTTDDQGVGISKVNQLAKLPGFLSAIFAVIYMLRTLLYILCSNVAYLFLDASQKLDCELIRNREERGKLSIITFLSPFLTLLSLSS